MGQIVHVNTLIMFEYIYRYSKFYASIKKTLKSYYILLCQHTALIGQIEK